MFQDHVAKVIQKTIGDSEVAAAEVEDAQDPPKKNTHVKKKEFLWHALTLRSSCGMQSIKSSRQACPMTSKRLSSTTIGDTRQGNVGKKFGFKASFDKTTLRLTATSTLRRCLS